MRFTVGVALIVLAGLLVGFSRPMGGALIIAVPCAVLGLVAVSGGFKRTKQ